VTDLGETLMAAGMFLTFLLGIAVGRVSRRGES
jgi:hypothetical protein